MRLSQALRFHPSMPSITLRSGRRLAFEHFGDTAGVPTFFFHGWPSSKSQGALLEEVAKERGLHVVAMDRPGIGESEFQPGRQLLDWPPVLEELAAHLGWEKFHLIGVSGGGPYVLATAHAMPERVLTATLICGAPPLKLLGTRQLFWPYRMAIVLRNLLPWLLAPFFKLAVAMSHLPFHRAPMRWIMLGLAAEDRRALADTETLRQVVQGFREALGSGVPCVQADGDIYTSDWGFDLRTIQVPVQVWHGRRDRNIPCAYAEKVAALLPNAIPHWTPNDGHYSLPILRVREIVENTLS